MSRDTYEYRLSYIDGDRELTHQFSAFITADEMRDTLKHFLLACSWTEEGVNKILGEDDE